MTEVIVAAANIETNPRQLAVSEMPPGSVWVLADRRAGTANQPLGIAERLGGPYRPVSVRWGGTAWFPRPWPSLAGLTVEAQHGIAPPWPSLVLSAGRRSAPVARWLGQRGARVVHCMWPDFAPNAFDLLVIGQHDEPAPARNVFPILGACHRLTPRVLATARAEWPEFGNLPSPRIALAMGGPIRAVGMNPATAFSIGAQVARFAGSVLATTSRRTGVPAGEALSKALSDVPHQLFRWGEHGRNPYVGMLAWADAVVVTGDSVSMLSEAMTTTAPIFIADPGGLSGRHRLLGTTLIASGQARVLADAPAPFVRLPLDETGRVAAEIRARGWF